MAAYREDQGRMARMAAFWMIALWLLFMSTFIHTQLSANFSGMENALGGARIPIIGVDVTIAFLISTVVFAICMVVMAFWVQTPKVADLLIDTESELRKVAWPTMTEVVNTCLVVIACVVILMAYLAGADWFLSHVIERILIG